MDSICIVCKKQYNKNINKPIILTCGDTICNACINNYKESLQKDEFECPKCCSNVKSMNIENKSAYPKIQNLKIESSIDHEFEIWIRRVFDKQKIILNVKKTMTISQLKDKIKEKYGYNKESYELAFKKPLLNKYETLEFYGITKSVTISMINKLEGGGPSYSK